MFVMEKKMHTTRKGSRNHVRKFAADHAREDNIAHTNRRENPMFPTLN